MLLLLPSFSSLAVMLKSTYRAIGFGIVCLFLHFAVNGMVDADDSRGVKLDNAKKPRVEKTKQLPQNPLSFQPSATFVWTGLGADSEMSTDQNWMGGVAPPTNDDTIEIVFADPSTQSFVTGSFYQCSSLVIDTGAGDFFFDVLFNVRNGQASVTGGACAYFYQGMEIGTTSSIQLSGSDMAFFVEDLLGFATLVTETYDPLDAVVVQGAGSLQLYDSFQNFETFWIGQYSIGAGVTTRFHTENAFCLDGSLTMDGPFEAVSSLVYLTGSPDVTANAGGTVLSGNFAPDSIQTNGEITVNGGSAFLSLVVDGIGSVNVLENGLTGNDLGGTIDVPVFVNQGAQVYGIHEYKNNVLIDGILDPGDQSFGTVTFDDLDLSGTSTTCIEVGPGTSGMIESDRVVGDSANATAVIDGTLVVEFDNAFVPDPGDEIFAFQDIDIAGTFDEVVFVNATCEIEYGSDFVRLHSFQPFDSPHSMTVVTGSLESGNVTDLSVSDDLAIEVLKGSTPPPFTDPGVVVEVEGQLGDTSPNGLTLVVEATANTDGLIQQIQCWDWTTSDWVVVHETTKTDKLGVDDSDASILVELTDEISSFVDAAGAVKTRLNYRRDPNGYVAQNPWTISIDRVAWTSFGGD